MNNPRSYTQAANMKCSTYFQTPQNFRVFEFPLT